MISVAPTKTTDYMTLVGRTEDWTKLIQRMATDKGHKDLVPLIKPLIDKEKTIQRITLPQGQAKKILRFCGISW